MLKYVAFDIETTGFSPAVNEIIELGAVKVHGDKIVDSMHYYVKPVRYIPRQITDLTGISMETVEYAPSVAEVLEEFHKWVDGYCFVGHNLDFDYRFICRYGADDAMVDFTEDGLRRGFDTLYLSRKFLGLKSNKLGDVAEHCNLSTGRLHNAQSDAMVTHNVFQWIKAHYAQEYDVQFPRYLSKKGTEYGKAVDNGTLQLW